MYILGFSIQIWLITVAAIAALVLSKRRKSKPLVAIGTVLAIVAVAAIGLQVSVWLSPPLAEVEDSRVPTSQEERQQVLESHDEAHQPDALPLYEDFKYEIYRGKSFEFDCTALSAALENVLYKASYHPCRVTYGDTEHEIELHIPSGVFHEEFTEGDSVHLVCRFVEFENDGTPVFEAISYEVTNE